MDGAEMLNVVFERVLQTFGIEKLKDLQREALEKLVGGEDVFVIQPTGSRKSLIFQSAPIVFDTVSLFSGRNKDRRTRESGGNRAYQFKRRACIRCLTISGPVQFSLCYEAFQEVDLSEFGSILEEEGKFTVVRSSKFFMKP